MTLALLPALLFAAAGTVAHPRAVPPGIDDETRAGLVLRATALEKRATELDSRIARQDDECGAVSSREPDYAAKVGRCTRQRTAIEKEWSEYETALDAYEADLDRHLLPPAPMPEPAAAFVKILEDASAEIELPKLTRPLAEDSPPDLRCQDFFRAVGRRLDARKMQSWSDSISQLKSANEIAAGIAKRPSQWRRLHKMDEAQGLANRGVIVVGASVNRQGHGHLGFVQPAPPDLDISKFDDEGTGPFVRDGNRHAFRGKTAPSTWGAIRASRAFKLGDTAWYAWIPSE